MKYLIFENGMSETCRIVIQSERFTRLRVAIAWSMQKNKQRHALFARHYRKNTVRESESAG